MNYRPRLVPGVASTLTPLTVTHSEQDTVISKLIETADSVVYEAKRAGGGRAGAQRV